MSRRKTLKAALSTLFVLALLFAAFRGSIVVITFMRVSPLIKALKDNDFSVGMSASKALGDIGPAAVPALIEALKDEDSLVRMIAAVALGKIGPDAKEAVPALVKALGDEEESVREASSHALHQIDPERGPDIDALTPGLE